MKNLQSTKKDATIYTLIALISVGIFGVDTQTSLGVAEWVFYLLPTGLCLLQSRPRFPLLLAPVESALILGGLYLSPAGVDQRLALINRSMGLVAVWIIAILVHQVISTRNKAQRLAWLQEGQHAVAQSMRGDQTVDELGFNSLGALARYCGARVGTMYRLDKDMLSRIGNFAASEPPMRIPLGEGLVGQVAVDGHAILVTAIPATYMPVASSIGRAAPVKLIVAPIQVDGSVSGVIELGFLDDAGDLSLQSELVQNLSDDIGIALRSAVYRHRLVELLEETQQQSEELQAQQEELRVSNEELEEQSRALKESQLRLENQHAELEQSNVRLEEQTQRLEEQKRDLIVAQQAMQANASELERVNRYKSEFLANMSHELRTPLTSSLILAKLLSDNSTGTLSEEQVKHAKTIYASNSDLLVLINDILDLAKIESGHLEMSVKEESLSRIVEPLVQMFEPVAKQKKIGFRTEIAPGTPPSLHTDLQRIQQILKNLLSNAFKFTDNGSVTLHVSAVADGRLAFEVRDTGIGIAPHQQEVVFEAFRQADGTTSRKYGGTGLGLSISRELAAALGGEIKLQSAPGQGSSFTLLLPRNFAPGTASRPAQTPSRETAAASTPALAPTPATPVITAGEAPHIPDDRDYLTRPGRLILVVEDDLRFAAILYEMAHEQAFDCIHASSAVDAIALARQLKPSGILLDIELPDQSGLSVLERLKRNSATRHIPIHMISVLDHARTAMELGAVGYALKPVAREEIVQAIGRLETRMLAKMRHILVVEDDETLRGNIELLLGGEDVQIVAVGTVAEALDHLRKTTFDCMVMDIMLPDASGYDLLEEMAKGERHAFPPVIVYTGRALTREEEQRLRKYANSIIVKGAKSPERLLDEVTLFLHRVESSLPVDQQQLLKRARQRDEVFEGRRMLLVEDDIRNVYALSALIETLGARLDIARNGREALDYLAQNETDLVLMDVMMPEMDGLTAMREIRKRPELAKLPIIALTAKAMADDRQQCLQAGANDYIAKPVDTDKLVSLCRIWLPK